jgi:hypothetical protein
MLFIASIVHYRNAKVIYPKVVLAMLVGAIIGILNGLFGGMCPVFNAYMVIRHRFSFIDHRCDYWRTYCWIGRHKNSILQRKPMGKELCPKHDILDWYSDAYLIIPKIPLLSPIRQLQSLERVK